MCDVKYVAEYRPPGRIVFLGLSAGIFKASSPSTLPARPILGSAPLAKLVETSDKGYGPPKPPKRAKTCRSAIVAGRCLPSPTCAGCRNGRPMMSRCLCVVFSQLPATKRPWCAGWAGFLPIFVLPLASAPPVGPSRPGAIIRRVKPEAERRARVVNWAGARCSPLAPRSPVPGRRSVPRKDGPRAWPESEGSCRVAPAVRRTLPCVGCRPGRAEPWAVVGCLVAVLTRGKSCPEIEPSSPRRANRPPAFSSPHRPLRGPNAPGNSSSRPALQGFRPPSALGRARHGPWPEPLFPQLSWEVFEGPRVGFHSLHRVLPAAGSCS